jgi:hypothetical protein
MNSSDRRIFLWACLGAAFALLGALAAMYRQPDAAAVLLTVAVSCAIAMMVEIVRVVIR